MEQEVFRAGVRPGGPTTGDEVKILICYILSKIEGPMSFSQLHEALSEQELVNYFELVSAMDALENTGHIESSPDGAGAQSYSVTELGRNAAGVIKGLLPASVRDRALRSASRLLRRKKREKEVVARITASGAGFEVKLGLPGGGSELLGLSVFCPTREEAELVRKRFLNDPTYIYKGVLALLTGDKQVIGKMFPENEALF